MAPVDAGRVNAVAEDAGLVVLVCLFAMNVRVSRNRVSVMRLVAWCVLTAITARRLIPIWVL